MRSSGRGHVHLVKKRSGINMPLKNALKYDDGGKPSKPLSSRTTQEMNLIKKRSS